MSLLLLLQQPQSAPQSGASQQVYDQLMSGAMETILGEQGMDKSIEVLSSAQSPEHGVGQLISQYLIAVYGRLRKQNKTIPPNIVLLVIRDLAKLLADLLVKSEKLSPEQGEQAFDRGVYVAIQMLAQSGKQSGLISPEEAQQFTQLLQQVAQAAGQQSPQQPGQSQPQQAQGGANGFIQ